MDGGFPSSLRLNMYAHKGIYMYIYINRGVAKILKRGFPPTATDKTGGKGRSLPITYASTSVLAARVFTTSARSGSAAVMIAWRSRIGQLRPACTSSSSVCYNWGEPKQAPPRALQRLLRLYYYGIYVRPSPMRMHALKYTTSTTMLGLQAKRSL